MADVTSVVAIGVSMIRAEMLKLTVRAPAKLKA
jgi:hypothetical protein